jgi:hypothetical protein
MSLDWKAFLKPTWAKFALFFPSFVLVSLVLGCTIMLGMWVGSSTCFNLGALTVVGTLIMPFVTLLMVAASGRTDLALLFALYCASQIIFSYLLACLIAYAFGKLMEKAGKKSKNGK